MSNITYVCIKPFERYEELVSIEMTMLVAMMSMSLHHWLVPGPRSPSVPRPDCLRVSAGRGAARADHLLRRVGGAAAVTWCNSVWLRVPHLTLHDTKQRANLQLGPTRRNKNIFSYKLLFPHIYIAMEYLN